MQKNNHSIEKSITSILNAIGEDPDREGLQRTPLRVEQSMKYLTQGYNVDVDKLINGAIYHEDVQDMVVVIELKT